MDEKKVDYVVLLDFLITLKNDSVLDVMLYWWNYFQALMERETIYILIKCIAVSRWSNLCRISLTGTIFWRKFLRVHKRDLQELCLTQLTVNFGRHFAMETSALFWRFSQSWWYPKYWLVWAIWECSIKLWCHLYGIVKPSKRNAIQVVKCYYRWCNTRF